MNDTNSVMAPEALTAYAEVAFKTLRRHGSEFSPELSKDVACAVGRYARRYGVARKLLLSWLQSAYGGVWITQMALRPGIDLKELQKLVLHYYDGG